LCELGVPHISIYALHAAKKSAYRLNGDGTSDDDTLVDILSATRDRLTLRSLAQYEVSNYSIEDGCRHNMLTWSGRDYLGFGSGAHSALRRGTETVRIRNTNLIRYLASSFIKTSDEPGLPCADSARLFTSNTEQAILETIMVQLRRVQGIDRQRFKERFDFDLVDKHSSFWDPYLEKEYVCLSKSALFPSELGIWLADGIAQNYAKWMQRVQF